MKVEKVIITIILILLIININVKCYAKYVFEHTMKAAEILINN